MKTNPQFKEISDILRDILKDHQELTDKMFSEVRDTIPLELSTYRLLERLEMAGWVQLVETDEEV